MEINFFFENIVQFEISKTKDIKWISDCITSKSKTVGNINYIFCSDSYLLELNKTHLNHDYFTDIITFDYCENDLVSADIYISIDRVGENANEFNQSFNQELHRVMIHGILHLLGYDDHSNEDKLEMRKAEDECLAKYANLI